MYWLHLAFLYFFGALIKPVTDLDALAVDGPEIVFIKFYLTGSAKIGRSHSAIVRSLTPDLSEMR